MKKLMVVFAVLVMMFFAGNAFAGHGQGNCGEGVVGLEISGGSLVGAQGYIGSTFTYSAHDSCFSSSRALDKADYIGVNLMSSANGTACLNTSGNSSGGIEGYGNFKAGAEGSILGIDFYTNSRVNISGWSN